jgi:hypothetical protein
MDDLDPKLIPRPPLEDHAAQDMWGRIFTLTAEEARMDWTTCLAFCIFSGLLVIGVRDDGSPYYEEMMVWMDIWNSRS